MHAMTTRAKPSLAFWLIAGLLFLWALGGVSIYAALAFEGAARFARTAETAENAEAYAAYVSAIPPWALGLAIAAAGARFAGAVALLLRRAWALPLFAISALLFIATLVRGFVFSNAASVMNAAHIAVEGVFLALSLFAIWFSADAKARGILA